MADNEIMNWEGGEEMDEEIRQGNTVVLDLGSDDEPPPSSDDDDGMASDNDDRLVEESELYPDEFPAQDDSFASVEHKQSVLSIAMRGDTFVSGGQDEVAVVWGLEELTNSVKCVEHGRLEGHSDSVTQVAFSGDGQYVATASYDGTVRIWNSNRVLAHVLEGPTKEVEWITWHPKGNAILAGSNDTMAWMWWAPTGKIMQIFAGHAGGVTCGCWPLDGKLICTGSEDRSIIVWNPRGGTAQKHVRDLHEGGVLCICAHPESPVVVTGSHDAAVSVVHIETGNVLTTLSGHTDGVEVVSFSNAVPSGVMMLATAGMDGKLFVWDAKTYNRRCLFEEHAQRGGIVSLKWLPPPVYGLWLCTCGTDGALRLYDTLVGQCLRTFYGHKDTILAFDLALVPFPSEPRPPKL